jgi:DNA repair protein RecN (Recombination protein N)
VLRTLSIRDFVIIDRLDLEFGSGFTALTGETGAGKSILVDALALVLGGRAEADVVRAGAARAEVCAEFDVRRVPQLEAWLREAGLEGDAGCCMLRRVIEGGGRSRAFVNGRAATAAQLREAGECLVDIHGQHVHQSLVKPSVQRDLLDAYAGAQADAAAVSAAWREWRSAAQRRERAEQDARHLRDEHDRLEWRSRELESVALAAGEWESLNAEQGRLAHAASLIEAAETGLAALSGDEGGCLTTLNAVISSLGALTAHDASLRETVDLLSSAGAEIQDAVYDLRRYRQRLEVDPARLHEIDRRLEQVLSVARKLRIEPQALRDEADALRVRLAELESGLDLKALADAEAGARRQLDALAATLTRERRKAAKRLGTRITAAMQSLAMEGAAFTVELRPLDAPTAAGAETIEFLVAANAGQPARPLAKVASGGELSRVSLAMQTVMGEVARVPVLVFDEVDAGIGGRVAEIVGRMLHDLAARYQVMCVTHLPQVAARADAQWRISKDAVQGQTRSTVEVLDREGRVGEIARMLAGERVTATARRHAAELLGAARD